MINNHVLKSVLSTTLSMLMLFSNTLAAFAEQPVGNQTASMDYKQYVATPLDGEYYKIAENTLKIPTARLSSCATYGRGLVSVPGETGDSPELCWVAGKWSSCSNSCGAGTMSREVNCMDLFASVSSECLAKLKLPETKECKDFSNCQYTWKTTPWEECHAGCGDSFKTREAKCFLNEDTLVEDVFCETSTKPETQVACASYTSCGFTPVYGSWSTCSSSCGTGTQTRTATCLRDDQTEVDLPECGDVTTSQSCSSVETCDYEWTYSAWSQCSTTCGNGTQNRVATCTRSDETSVNELYCTESPDITQSCTNISACGYAWDYGTWGECSTFCGEGVKTRVASCKRGDDTVVANSFCTATPSLSEACIETSSCSYAWESTAWEECSTSCGTGSQERNSVCKRSDGETVSDDLCTSAKPASTQTCSDSSSCGYEWETTAWGSCSTTCGTGTQTRTADCKRSDGTTVADNLCAGDKPEESMTCSNTSTCSYEWDITAWGSCSTTCGTGTQTRTSTCKRSDGTTVADSFCTSKPSSSQACVNVTTCTTAWNYGSWGACSTTCGTGTQSRSATCLRSDGTTVANSNCTAIATTSQSCTDVSTCTYSWNTTAWGSCSNTCGTGTQTRTSTCKRSDGTTVADTFCPAKPSSSQSCTDVSTCTYSWNTTAWGLCSTTCGTGTQTRTSTCKRSDGTTVADTFCSAKPAGSQACTATTSCTYSWNTTAWGSCSTTCGTGIQTRTSTCKRSDGTTVADTFCSAKPAGSQACTITTSCTYHWNTTAWGGCSVACGTGTQYRSSTCVRSDGATVASAYCGTVPTASQACSVYTGCSYQFIYGGWSACSASCPTTPTQSRTVYCKRSDGATVSNAYCGTPVTSQACSACTTGCISGDAWYYSNSVANKIKDHCTSWESCTYNFVSKSYICKEKDENGGGD